MKYSLSICIPTYNGYEKLRHTLTELVSRVDSSRVQICVSDNGSTDKTGDFVLELQKNHDNLKYFRYESNQGICTNFYNAMYIADGNYCWLMGDDDLPIFEEIDNIVAFSEQKNPDVFFVNSMKEKRNYVDEESTLIDGLDDYIVSFSQLSTWISVIIAKNSVVKENPFIPTDNAFPHVMWLFSLMGKGYVFGFFSHPSVIESRVYSCTYNDRSLRIFSKDLLQALHVIDCSEESEKKYIRAIGERQFLLDSIIGFRAKGGITLQSVRENWDYLRRYSLRVKVEIVLSLLLPRFLLSWLYRKYKDRELNNRFGVEE